MHSRRTGFTLIELLVVIAIIAILAAILFPVFARARAKAQQTACLSNMKQIALGIIMYASDHGQKVMGTPARPDVSWCACTGDPFGCWFPSDPRAWPWKVLPYIRNQQIFACPSVSNIDQPFISAACGASQGRVGYSPNGNLSNHNGTGGIALEAIPNPADIVMLQELGGNYQANSEGSPYWSGTGYCCGFYMRPDLYPAMGQAHGVGRNLAFADGHAVFMDSNASTYRMWGLQPEPNVADFMETVAKPLDLTGGGGYNGARCRQLH